jgi:antibiotic biosynthesis monooxygenase (ABM) superfamily enzyme
MYTHVTQFDTRSFELAQRLLLDDEIRGARGPKGETRPALERRASRPGRQRWKLALVTWPAAYGVITVALALLDSSIASWPLALRTLVMSAVMVTSLTWLIMPSLVRLFRGWLNHD